MYKINTARLLALLTALNAESPSDDDIARDAKLLAAFQVLIETVAALLNVPVNVILDYHYSPTVDSGLLPTMPSYKQQLIAALNENQYQAAVNVGKSIGLGVKGVRQYLLENFSAANSKIIEDFEGYLRAYHPNWYAELTAG